MTRLTRFDAALKEANGLNGTPRKSKSYLVSFLYELLRDVGAHADIVKVFQNTINVNPHAEVEFSDPFLFDKANWLASQLTREREWEKVEWIDLSEKDGDQRWVYRAVGPFTDDGRVVAAVEQSRGRPLWRIYKPGSNYLVDREGIVDSVEQARETLDSLLIRDGWMPTHFLKKQVDSDSNRSICRREFSDVGYGKTHIDYMVVDGENSSSVGWVFFIGVTWGIKQWEYKPGGTGKLLVVKRGFHTQKAAQVALENLLREAGYDIVDGKSKVKKTKKNTRTGKVAGVSSKTGKCKQGKSYEVVTSFKLRSKPDQPGFELFRTTGTNKTTVGDIHQLTKSAIVSEREDWWWRSLDNKEIFSSGQTKTREEALVKLQLALRRRGFTIKGLG